jgi:hypothetical protein
MIRAIQRRAPNFSSSRLLGTSHKKYETKKSPAAEAEYGRGQAKVSHHLQRRKAQIDAVDERNEVTDRQEGNDAQGNLPHRPRFQCVSLGHGMFCGKEH